jgi:hypothetical protein
MMEANLRDLENTTGEKEEYWLLAIKAAWVESIDHNCDVLLLSLDDLLNYITLMLKFCTNKRIWASMLRQVCF